MSENKRRTEYRISPERFIEVWQTSRTMEEVAGRLGMPKAIAQARASTYRGKGIILKTYERMPKNVLKVSDLKRLAEDSYREYEQREAAKKEVELTPGGAAVVNEVVRLMVTRLRGRTVSFR